MQQPPLVSPPTEDAVAVVKKRRICEGCGRPSNVCLCEAMPNGSPLSLNGHVIVIRHPNEKSKNLATIPILQRCLKRMSVWHGRRYKVLSFPTCEMVAMRHATILLSLQEGSDAEVDSLLQASARGEFPLFLLYPGPGAGWKWW